MLVAVVDTVTTPGPGFRVVTQPLGLDQTQLAVLGLIMAEPVSVVMVPPVAAVAVVATGVVPVRPTIPLIPVAPVVVDTRQPLIVTPTWVLFRTPRQRLAQVEPRVALARQTMSLALQALLPPTM